MNILEVSFSMYPFVKYGGTERSVYYLSKEMGKTANVKVITCTNSNIKLDVVKIPNVKVPLLKGLVFQVSVMAYVVYLKAINRLNIVHIHGVNSRDFPMVELARLMGARTVITVHGSFPKEKTYLKLFNAIICESHSCKNEIANRHGFSNVVAIPAGVMLDGRCPSFKESS